MIRLSTHLLLFVAILIPMVAPLSGGRQPDEQRPVVGVVLSGGGARGGAHIGVLRQLEEAGVPIDVISGTSFGALVGGLYSVGFTTEDLELLVSSVDWDELFDDRVDRRILDIESKDRSDRGLLEIGFSGLDVDLPRGLMTGQKIRQLLDRLTTFPVLEADNDFDKFPIRFRAVAADVLTGDIHVFHEGSLAEAIRASIAVPFLFTPVEMEDTYLVDGGVSDNLPVDAAKEAGADIIIAVDISTPLKQNKEEIQSVVDVIDQIIGFRIEERKQKSLEKAHFVIQPDLEGFTGADFDRMAELVEVGYREASGRMEELTRLLETLKVTRQTPKRTSRLDSDTFDLKTSVVGDTTIHPDRVEVEGLGGPSLVEQKIAANAKPDTGEDLVNVQSELYATNRFETVTFRLGDEPGEQVLTFQLKERAPVQLGVGLRYDRDYKFTGTADLLAHLSDGRRSELGVRALFGNVENLEFRFKTSPWLKSFFFEPSTYYLSHLRRAYSSSSLVLDLQDRRFGFLLPAGFLLGRNGRLTLGYRFENLESGENLAGADDERQRLAGPEIGFDYDSLDSVSFPESGQRLSASYQYRDSTFGSEFKLSRLLLDSEAVFRLSERSVVSLTGSWGVVDGDEVPIVERFFTGGGHYLSFSSLPFFGLSRDQKISRHFVNASANYRYLVKSYPLGLVRRIYLGGKYQAGLFNRGEALTDFGDLLHGFGGGVYLDLRFLGPISVEMAGTDEKDFNFYFSIGYPF